MGRADLSTLTDAELERAFLSAIPIGGPPPKPQVARPGLRPYQIEAIEAVFDDWREHKSTVLEMATGTGKTISFCEVIKRRRDAGCGRALVLAHRQELIDQAADTLRKNGLTVDVERAQQHALRSALIDVSDVVVGSVQTLQGKRLQRWRQDSFGTVVIDECHHAPSKSYRAIMSHFSEAKILGVTATPDRGDRIGLGNVFDSVAYRYPIRQAIHDGYLCPITAQRVFCADMDLSNVRTTHGDLSESDLQAALTVDKVLHQIAAPLVELAGARPTIIFLPGVAAAEAFAEILGAYVEPGRAAVIHGSQPTSVRAEVIRRYREGKIQFLSNCAVLTEGFDAPWTACIAMARPTKSRAMYAQCIGRGTRLAPKKDDLLILDFVGNSGRHRLVGPADVLAGKELPPEIQRQVDEASSKNAIDVDGALLAAEERHRGRLERLAEEQRRRNVRAEVSFRAERVDPFGNAMEIVGARSADSKGPRATENQIDALKRYGVEVSKQPSRAEASTLIEALKNRRQQGLCTYKQARTLVRAGLRADLTFEEAKSAIDHLAANRWRPTGELVAQFGRKAVA